MKTGNYSYGVLTNGIRWNFHLFKNGKPWKSYEIDLKEEVIKRTCLNLYYQKMWF